MIPGGDGGADRCNWAEDFRQIHNFWLKSGLFSGSEIFSNAGAGALDFQINVGATLAVSNSIANGATVTFAGGTGELTLDDPESFSGTIVNFSGYAANAAQSDVIDLVGSNENSAGFATNYGNGVLTVTDGTDTAELTCSNFNRSFVFASGGNGGKLIYVTNRRIDR